MSGPPIVRIAAFDLDGTITERDCVVPFLRQVAGTAGLALTMARRPVSLARSGLRRDRDALKAAAARAAFGGRSRADVEQLAVEFAGRVHRDWLRPDSVERIGRHRDAGDPIVVVSASFEVYVAPLAALLGIDGVLATRLGVDGAGTLTGELDGANCRGPEKVRRLHEWLDVHHGGRGRVEVVAYGDSAGDRELLADADTAHWMAKR